MALEGEWSAEGLTAAEEARLAADAERRRAGKEAAAAQAAADTEASKAAAAATKAAPGPTIAPHAGGKKTLDW